MSPRVFLDVDPRTLRVPGSRRTGDAMSVATTDELIDALIELRRLFPDWRMGQLVANLAMAAGVADAAAIWDVSDENLVVAAHRLIEQNRGCANENESQ